MGSKLLIYQFFQAFSIVRSSTEMHAFPWDALSGCYAVATAEMATTLRSKFTQGAEQAMAWIIPLNGKWRAQVTRIEEIERTA